MTIERCGWSCVDEDANPAVTPKRKWARCGCSRPSHSANLFTGIRLTNVDLIDPVFSVS